MERSTTNGLDRQASRVLVYDDDRVLLDVLVTLLEREGYQVTATQSEREAIALARTQHFDLAMVDLGRWRSKGYELVDVVHSTLAQGQWARETVREDYLAAPSVRVAAVGS